MAKTSKAPNARSSPKKGGVKKVMNDRPEGVGRPVIYPAVKVIVYSGDGAQKTEVVDRPAITAKKMKEILKWESEPEYVTRQQKIDPTFNGGLPDVGKQVKYTDQETGVTHTATVLLKDEEGHKVVCWNVVGNRPFDKARCDKYVQDMANRQWAGPTTLPGETFNGETFLVSRTGKVESGQKRGVALVLLWQKWRKQLELGGTLTRLWPPEQYPEGPVIDIPIFVGISESPKVIRTIDEVQPRSIADTVFTSPIFEELTYEKKLEASKAMGTAAPLLWNRVGGRTTSTLHQLLTHSEATDFIDRHPRLRRCVLHIIKCDSGEGKSIRYARLGLGECAAIMYLMAHGDSDINAYRNADPSPKESVLTCSLMAKAEAFWKEFGAREGSGAIVSEAVAAVVDKDAGSIKDRKYAILAKAWSVYVEGLKITNGDVALTEEDFQTDQNGKKSLALPYTFNHDDMGIDCGPKVHKAEEEKSVEAARKSKEEEHKKAVEEAEARLGKSGKKNGNGKKNGDKASTADFGSWEPDAETAADDVIEDESEFVDPDSLDEADADLIADSEPEGE